MRFMRKLRLLTILALTLCFSSLDVKAERQDGLFRGYEGGMMVHTGYLRGSFPQIGHSVSGMPVGIGGMIKIRLGNHWRVGSEGYASILPQLKNGSYSRFGWGGILGDFYWTFVKFSPFVGVTLGGGANSNLLILDEQTEPWTTLDNSYFNRRGFFAIAPFVGCNYAVTNSFQLTLKADWLNGISASGNIPSGPRLYFGFVFCH